MLNVYEVPTFACFGLPRYICFDNGTAFTSEEFKTFVKCNGIHHLTGPLFHPASNGQAESSVKIMKKVILKVQLENPTIDTDLIISRFLFQYRNTPHTITREAPAKLLIGHKLRSRFDLLLPCVANDVQSKQMNQIKNYKGILNSVWVKDYRNNLTKWLPAVVIKKVGNQMYFVKLLDYEKVATYRSNETS